MDTAQQAKLKNQRCGDIFSVKRHLYFRNRSVVSAITMSTQYVIRAGPAPNCIRMRMIKTSPIEMTVDTFGNLTFIVETNADNRSRANHCSEKSFVALKQSQAKGIEAR